MTCTRLLSFDGTEVVNALIARPERYRDLSDRLSTARFVIARGAGLSLSAASMGGGALSIDLGKFNRILAFDAETGDVSVEPGVTVGFLTEFLHARGFFLPVVPGYPGITVGGCVAFDVHGKNQMLCGNFGAWVSELELFHASHGVLTASPERNSSVFELTLGGFGMTGVITRVSLKTLRSPGTAVEVETIPVSGLVEAASVLDERAAGAAALYSWHNCSSNAARFGSGFVRRETFVHAAPQRQRGQRGPYARTRMRRAPVALWNRLTAAYALAAYERTHGARSTRVVEFSAALFPIAGLEAYYAAFGTRGFREYQVLVPKHQWPDFAARFEALVRRTGVVVTLASLKLFRGSASLLRFRGSGVCLAVDVPAGAASLGFFEALDDLTVASGGCLNLSKDSRIGAALCRRVFPDYEAFVAQLRAYDPTRWCRSALSDRIDV